VTDYGVRLTVRVGNLSPLACAPFRVFILYTVSPLRGGRFHRPFQWFSAQRYVSTIPSTRTILGTSILERLSASPRESIVSLRLNVQYRMHEDNASFISRRLLRLWSFLGYFSTARRRSISSRGPSVCVDTS
jgi:hypothetical protein